MSVYSVPQKLLDGEYSSSMDPKYFYETSNMRDYKGTVGKAAPSARPGTSNFYTKTNTEKTGYQDEFSWKKAEPKSKYDRPGTASGQRKNNPHPSEDFVAWKFAKSSRKLEDDDELKKELLEELCRDKIRSTYQVDYQNEDNVEKTPDKRIVVLKKRPIHKAPHTLDTTIRADYQSPKIQEKCLKSNTTRFGCNSNKTIPALGAVPAAYVKANLRYCDTTSYSDEFTAADKKSNSDHELSGEQVRISNWEGPSW